MYSETAGEKKLGFSLFSGKILTTVALIAILAVGCFVLINDSDSSEATEEINGSCGENLTWTIGGDTLTISGTGDMTGWQNYSIRPWNEYRDQIKHVVIEEGVTSIGGYAFYLQSTLETVSISDTVTSIGNEAFR